MPAWIWVISQGTLMDLGIQIPQKINFLSHVLLQTLSFPHVLRAELLLLDPGWCPQPMGDQALTRHSISSSPSSASSPQHLHLGYLPSSGARPWGRPQVRPQWEMHRKTPRRSSSVHGFGKTLRERQGPATKPAHMAPTTLLGQIWPDNLKAFTDSATSLPQVKQMYRNVC